MATVRVVMMQRDEGDMLARWLAYYGGLFGFTNLSIIDNGTTDDLTLKLLQEAEGCGVKIYWGLNSQADFQGKGVHIRNVISHWDRVHNYDFALPVDCDEILAVFTDNGLTMDHGAIMAEMDRLKPFKCAFRLDMSLFNVPERPGWFAPDRSFYKGFLPSGSVEVVDNGFHQPQSKLAPGFMRTRLTYLHWHNRPYLAALALARAKMRGRVDVDDVEALKAYAKVPRAPGAHLIEMLLMASEDYPRRYDHDVRIFVPPNGARNFLGIGDGVAIWDTSWYLHRNPDVERYELPPLHHFLRYGYSEKRHLR